MALAFPGMLEFDNPRLEGRRLFSELLGTFMLVLVGAGGGVVAAVSHGMISRAAAVTAPGLMVMAIILFMGAVSGAHLNPAVTIAFTLRRNFPWRRAPGYIAVQLVGATLACLFLQAVFGKVGMLGATEPGPHIHDWQAMLDRVGLDRRSREHDPRHRLAGAERRRAVGARCGRIHHPRRAMVEPGERSFHESRAVLRPGSADRQLRALLGLSRRAASRAR